jgi:iron-sulfur cluster repair protein YtfE (RIC family)
MSATRVLVGQHRAIAALFADVVREARRHGRARAVAHLAEELIAHMAAEEAVFYPTVRRALGADGAIARRLRDEHLELRVQLRRVLETDVGHPSFRDRFHELRALFGQHVRAEEMHLFPSVEAAMGRAELEVLGAQVLASRPAVWIVTAESRPPATPAESWPVRSRVSLPAVRDRV